MKRILDRQLWRIMLLGALVAVLLAGTSQAALVGWWAMDDANYPPGYFDPPPIPTTPDSSANGNTGTLDGTCTTGTALGYNSSGYSATFDGGAIVCGDDVSLKPQATDAGLSFASWVKFDQLNLSYQLVGSDWSDPSQLFHFGAEQDNLRVHFGNADGHYYKSVGINDVLTLDTWTHVAFTVAPAASETEPGDIKLYMNGAEVASGTYEFTTLPVTTNPIILGEKLPRNVWPLHGSMDETALWTSVLSGSDVAALYNGTTSPTSVGTLGGYWQFENEASSPVIWTGPTATVTDSLGLGQDGIMTPDGIDPFHPAGGKFGGAVEMLGTDDYINVGDIEGIDEEMTVACWIKPTDLSGLQIITSQSNDGNPTEWAWQVFLSGSTALFYVSDPTDHDGFVFVASASGITTDWSHLALTLSSNDGEETGEVKAYVNGVEVGSIVYDSESLVNSSEDILFGNKANVSVGSGFNGLIDDAGLFDTALSASEIAQIYSGGIASIPEPSTILMIFCGLAMLVCTRRR